MPGVWPDSATLRLSLSLGRDSDNATVTVTAGVRVCRRRRPPQPEALSGNLSDIRVTGIVSD